ncbi:DUF1178 family protein [Paragemmobacter ruber]|uniref:DUF1178 family protein n=1 Tax=Paragemmobacter ruber TaxID=1985673 RepID=A0ABW9Y301_9RHOB|nr:DUF1178 family protein [Rhodobacter ruber]NBE06319.1 DUF1178 family protein [Rhodobacter ruber]
MIRFQLKCAQDHGFDSWFQSGAAFDALKAAGHVACPVCGSAEVEKALMAPSVALRAGAEEAPALRAPANEREAALAALRRQVEENSDYVGMNFVTEARRIHSGEAPERAIHGEARVDEARKLIEEGVPVAPLPFLPSRKAN